MRAAWLTLMLLASAAVGAATVYRWVDAEGVVHYSDQPHPGAQKLEIGEIQTYSTTPAGGASNATPAQGAPEGPPYQVCELFRPQAEEVFFNTQTVTARLRVQPALRRGHTLFLALDGRRLPEAPAGTEVEISPVFRGTHTLVLVVEDGEGNVLCQSDPVTFHVRQPSVQAPRPANRPRF